MQLGSNPLKVLMIGLGGIGQRHTRNLRTLLSDSVEIIAYRVRGLTHLVTPTMDANRERNVEDVYNIRVFHNLDEALTEKPDIAYICNPSSLHVAVTRACLIAGCDIFLEKPVADSLDGTAELVDLAREHERVVMVGYQLRFHPCVIRLTEIVRSGTLGNLLGVRATIGEYLPNWHRYEDYRNMYAARADLGGGVILSQIHEFDYLYSLFGIPRRIYALGGHWSDLEIDVEDTASILMEASTGSRVLPIQLHQDFLQAPPSRQCEVIGDRGRVIMDLAGLTVSLFTRGQAEPEIFRVENFERNDLFLDQARHLLHCVATRERPIVDIDDGIQSLRMALAVKQSIATHQIVDLD
jgi:predicted dehydrogenase